MTKRGEKQAQLDVAKNTPRTARQVYEATLDYTDHDAWPRVKDAREAMEDEVAHARVLARRGLPAEESWKVEPDDPRLEAWASVHAEQLRAQLEVLNQAARDADFTVVRHAAERVAELAVLSGGGRAPEAFQ